MSRLAAALAVACLAFSACAVPAGPSVPPASQAASARISPLGGRLHVEPFAIVFSRDKGPAQTVRVWQKNYFGRYDATNLCAGVTVTLKGVLEKVGSIWDVALRRHSRPETCSIVFTGTGSRGKNSLHVSILR